MSQRDNRIACRSGTGFFFGFECLSPEPCAKSGEIPRRYHSGEKSLRVHLSKFKKRILNGGSLGSWIDEGRSKLRVEL